MNALQMRAVIAPTAATPRMTLIVTRARDVAPGTGEWPRSGAEEGMSRNLMGPAGAGTVQHERTSGCPGSLAAWRP
jgi:hypothetical protein